MSIIIVNGHTFPVISFNTNVLNPQRDALSKSYLNSDKTGNGGSNGVGKSHETVDWRRFPVQFIRTGAPLLLRGNFLHTTPSPFLGLAMAARRHHNTMKTWQLLLVRSVVTQEVKSFYTYIYVHTVEQLPCQLYRVILLPDDGEKVNVTAKSAW